MSLAGISPEEADMMLQLQQIYDSEPGSMVHPPHQVQPSVLEQLWALSPIPEKNAMRVEVMRSYHRMFQSAHRASDLEAMELQVLLTLLTELQNRNLVRGREPRYITQCRTLVGQVR